MIPSGIGFLSLSLTSLAEFGDKEDSLFFLLTLTILGTLLCNLEVLSVQAALSSNKN
jgi:hypothetical protein